MRKTIAILYLLAVSCCIAAAAESTDAHDVKDSLTARLKDLPHDAERLETLRRLIGESKSEPKEHKWYIGMMLEEAERQDNARYKCEAYYLYSFDAYNRYDIEEVDKWTGLLIPLARKHKLYELMFKGLHCSVDFLIIKEQYELHEKEANKMLREAQALDNTLGIIYAYQSLALGYAFTFRYKEAFETFEKAYGYAETYGDMPTICNIAASISDISKSRNDTANWIKYIKEQETAQKKYLDKNPDKASVFHVDMMLTYASFLEYYSRVKDMEKATRSLETLELYHSEDYSPLHQKIYHLAKYVYYSALGDTDKALEEIDAALCAMKPISDLSYYAYLPVKARMLADRGMVKEALELYRETVNAKDSLNNLILDNQTEQIRKSYDLDNVLMENRKIQRQIRLTLIAMLALALAAVTYFVIRFRRAGKGLMKVEAETAHMAAEEETANAAKERFLSNISASIRPALDTIVKYSSFISSDETMEEEEKKRICGAVNKASEELTDMIDDILMLSKLEAGMLKLNASPVEMVPLLRTAGENGGTGSGTRVELDIPGQAEWTVSADIGYLSRMIMSLTAGTVQGYGCVRLRAEEVPGGSLRIEACGSALAGRTQEYAIRNEINRMLAGRFSGTYEIKRGRDGSPCIVIELPLQPRS